MPDQNTGAEGVVDTQTQDTSTTDTTVEAASASAPEWDGDWSKVSDQAWYKSLPDSARTHLDKRLSEYEEKANRADFLDRMFKADDSAAALLSDLDHHKAQLASLQKALDSEKAERTKASEGLTSAQQRLAEIEADRAYDAMAAKYPDIFADVYYKDDAKTDLEEKGAYMTFLNLLQRGLSEDQAAKYARLELPAQVAGPTKPTAPARPAERAVEVPKGVRAATIPGNSASTTIPSIKADEDIDKAIAAAREKARLEDGAR